MSTPPDPSQPPFPGRRRPATPETSTGRATTGRSKLCRICRETPALPDDDACEACGDRAIERTRVGVDSWLSMHAHRVRELEREERGRGDHR